MHSKKERFYIVIQIREIWKKKNKKKTRENKEKERFHNYGSPMTTGKESIVG